MYRNNGRRNIPGIAHVHTLINQRQGGSEILGVFNTVSGGSQHTVGRYIRTIAGLRVIVSVDRVTVVVISRVHLVADAVAIRLGIRTGVGSGKMQAEIKCLGGEAVSE